MPVLDQHRRLGILEDDVVLRIALGQLLANFLVEIVGGVLRLPIAERHAQIVQDRAVGPDTVLLRRFEFVLADEVQMVLLGPGLEQILERLADDAFGEGA
ncbi:MAG TPA: hypothetical protein VGV58_23010 [Bosea sp. (in: a-proteobacteria)]|nr:hypothetical protein [Bosea sp. (in: a-proteobacteria)]